MGGGTTKFLGDTDIFITETPGSNTAQELGEIGDVHIDGNIKIRHNSGSHAVFYFGENIKEFKIKENSTVDIDSTSTGGLFRVTYNWQNLSVDIEKNAKVRIAIDNGMFYNSIPGKYFHVHEGADVEIIKRKDGRTSTFLLLKEDLVVHKNARLVMKNLEGRGYFAEFVNIDSFEGPRMVFDDPLNVIMQHGGTEEMFKVPRNVLTNTMYINSMFINYWQIADIDDRPLHNWTMPNNSNIIAKVFKDNTGNTYIDSDDTNHPNFFGGDFNLSSAKAISLGRTDKEITDPVDPTDPTDPGEPANPEPPKEGTAGPLSIDYASDLFFGEKFISSKDETYYAKAQKFSGERGAGPNYVQVTDKRREEEGWHLQVKQDGQFMTAKGKELTGAEITFKNMKVNTISESTKPTIADSLALTIDEEGNGVAQTIMSTETGQGAGTYVLAFGDDNTAEESIELHVPGKTTKYAEKYDTTLTWTLTNTPGQE